MTQIKDNLILEKETVIFTNVEGKQIEMPNLSKLVQMYKTSDIKEVKERIKAILSEDIGKLLVVEIMMDMTQAKIIERLHTGEISKTMGHVQTYNVILDSHIDEARAYFNSINKEEKSFEQTFFAQFPCGIVIEEKHLEGYRNEHGEVAILNNLKYE